MLKRDNDHHALERHLHPSIYKRIRKTEALIQKNVDPAIFRAEGGLDMDTYQALHTRWVNEEERIEGKKQKLIGKYGSITDIPLKIGPCKKIDPVIGTKRPLVLLIDFQDKKHTAIYDSEYFKDLLFSKGSDHSMRDYYLEASWNQLDINGDVSDEWYLSSLNYSDYLDKFPVEGHYPKAQKLVKEAVLQAKKSKKFDFSPYVKDGKIEILIVIYAGYGFDNKLEVNYIRPHKDRFLDPIEVQEDIWTDRYALIPELPADDLGCFCHEVGHLLGLPDLYKEGYSPVVGGWCLMAVGCYNNNCRTPAHPSAWCKIHLGWVEPQLVQKNLQSYQIPSIIQDKVIYRLDVEDSNGKEYFLLENRQQNGFDKYLPGSGLLIWHVDEDVCVAQAPNNDPNHFFLTLKESDGREDLLRDMTVFIKEGGVEKAKKELTGDTGDAFPGETFNRNFDDFTKPNSHSYKGHLSGVKVVSISDSGDLMEADMGVRLLPTEDLDALLRVENVPRPISKPKYYFSPRFLTFLFSSKPKDPYQEGLDAYLEDLQEEVGINYYRDGYRQGYRQGYEDAIKKLKKSKKIIK